MHVLPTPPPEDESGQNLPEAPRYKDAQEAARIYFLPNLFTAGNLFFGFVAIIYCIQARYVAQDDQGARDLYIKAVECILLAGFCDALDGRLARLGGRESLFGKEFDSIADTVSFGVAPALMVFFLILGPAFQDYSRLFQEIGWLVGFVYLLCVAVRLARFNVLTNPLLPGASAKAATKDFMGLPSPAAAGFVASLVLVLLSTHLDLSKATIQASAILLLPLPKLQKNRLADPNQSAAFYFSGGSHHRGVHVAGVFVCGVFSRLYFLRAGPLDPPGLA
jgi:CDP-diacylglycerol--serine O-phosphatidyltransferase